MLDCGQSMLDTEYPAINIEYPVSCGMALDACLSRSFMVSKL
jgi:hypothetical protein